MHSLEALVLGERGETDQLQLFQLRGVFRARLSDHKTISQFSVIPTHEASQENTFTPRKLLASGRAPAAGANSRRIIRSPRPIWPPGSRPFSIRTIQSTRFGGTARMPLRSPEWPCSRPKSRPLATPAGGSIAEQRIWRTRV